MFTMDKYDTDEIASFYEVIRVIYLSLYWEHL